MRTSSAAQQGEAADRPCPAVDRQTGIEIAMKHGRLISSAVALTLFCYLSVVLDAAEASTRLVVYLGSYEKVESASGEHCSGYSIDLWKHDDALFGLLHHHRGLCGDPPCGVLADIRNNTETGDFRFQADTLEAKFYFSGSLEHDVLTGTLTTRWPGTETDSKETVRLPKHRKQYLADKLDSLEKWHEFHDPIARCHGVKTSLLSG